MTQKNRPPAEEIAQESPPSSKKPYKKPEFRFERVFETMALRCGKTAGVPGPRCAGFRRRSS